MAIFYTDTGSFNSIEVSGSAILSGSLIVSGTTNFGPGGLTGSLFGTSSWAQQVEFITNNQINEAISGGDLRTNDIISQTISSSILFIGADTPTTLGMRVTGSHQATGSISLVGDIQASTLSIDGASQVGSLSVNASTDFDGDVRLNTVVNTTNPNQILVVDNSTKQIYTTASVLPNGIISSSLQFNTFTTPFTGSFTGSFRGPLIGSASWASSSISSSFATTASFSRSSSFAPTILPSNLVSSSGQFNTFTTPFTGSFTGSFSGSLDRFNPVALRITVGTTAPSSPAVNDLWVDTN